MPAIQITDPDDPRIADYRALTDVALRTAFEPPHGLFIAEGELVLRRAVRAGFALRSILVDAKRIDQVDTIAPDVPLYAATPPVLEAITGFHVHRGVLGSVHRPAPADPAALLAAAQRVLILEDVNTHTNVGAIFRAAAGMGMDAILLSPSCADPLYRRSVRVSMGEVFAVPYGRLDPWPAALDQVRAAGFTLLALTPDPDAISLRALSPAQRERPALLLGAEGPGLSGEVLTAADARVRIPMHRGVDSLNVAAAAAVACYALAPD
ncbi:TrmH family RNA methyltransferase [Cryptosporangium aurantiacum]|uniref:tRNA G18 (Ribose-2'-O)-methylase SpoU n=1 Tax=Cryptosporangium aurantiacum TaxID=134849 RepID=A0A1M7JEV0_9ACTN|nr:RNA methyltransferase [Cryptosporangium aurantiacum]SHM51047.1 tRNA G18 (ribose-2'-O)-methylase SpoU [Cryptosporangium aurantiacum]